MISCGASLYELRNKMVKFPQTMINVKVKDKKDLQSVPAIRDAVASVEATLGRKGRVLLRPSGTEPVVRVMVEGEDAGLVQRLAEELAQQVKMHA
jgi:phosphoglucosamine mutase